MLELDLSGLNCPLPILKAKRFLSNLEPGVIVKIITTDLASMTDFQDFCKKTGNILLNQNDANGIITSVIKRRS